MPAFSNDELKTKIINLEDDKVALQKDIDELKGKIISYEGDKDNFDRKDESYKLDKTQLGKYSDEMTGLNAILNGYIELLKQQQQLLSNEQQLGIESSSSYFYYYLGFSRTRAVYESNSLDCWMVNLSFSFQLKSHDEHGAILDSGCGPDIVITQKIADKLGLTEFEVKDITVGGNLKPGAKISLQPIEIHFKSPTGSDRPAWVRATVLDNWDKVLVGLPLMNQLRLGAPLNTGEIPVYHLTDNFVLSL